LFNYFFPENRAIYEIVWENMVVPDKTTDDNKEYAHCMPAT